MVEGHETVAGRLFDLVIQILIVISLITFSIETWPDLAERTRRVLDVTEVMIVGLFSAEYVLRLLAAERKLHYVFSFYGMIDILAIAPFYLALGIDLRSLRILRLFRVIRIFKLFRYNQAIARFRRAMSIAKEEIVLFFTVSLMLLYIAAVGIYYFENPAQPEAFKSIFHSLWWAVATLTTVGYGDIYPVTAGGKIFTFIILMIGLGIVAVPAGLLASALSKARGEEK